LRCVSAPVPGQGTLQFSHPNIDRVLPTFTEAGSFAFSSGLSGGDVNYAQLNQQALFTYHNGQFEMLLRSGTNQPGPLPPQFFTNLFNAATNALSDTVVLGNQAIMQPAPQVFTGLWLNHDGQISFCCAKATPRPAHCRAGHFPISMALPIL
jgi:hypothetical protein